MASSAEDPTFGRQSARWINLVAGAWLSLSAFLWPHAQLERDNAWISGLLCIMLAAGATRFPALRFANTVLSVWIFFSAFAFPHRSVGTVYNGAFVALVVFIVSLTSPPARERAVTR